MEKYYKKNKFDKNRVKEFDARKEPVKMNHNGKTTFVSCIADRLTDREMFRYWEKGYDISDPRFKTAFDYTDLNLPHYRGENHFNFYFTKNMLEEMLNTPKVLIKTNTFMFNDDKGGELTGTKFYMLAPWLENTDLPFIYRLDILRSKENPDFYGFRAVAQVGGCIDGECPLFEVRCGIKDEPSKLYYARAETINPELSRCPHSELEQDDVFDICDYVFDAFSIKFIQSQNLSSKYLLDNAKAFRENRSLYTDIKGSDFLRQFDVSEINYQNPQEFVRKDRIKDADLSIKRDN